MQNEFKRLIIFIIVSVVIIGGFQIIQNKGGAVEVPKNVETVEIKKEVMEPTGIIIGPLNKLLHFTKDQTSNMGLAIIVMTLLLRLLFSPLQYMSIKSMKKMEEIKPYLEKIKKKFRDDPKTMQLETIKLYKEKSINPLMGIFPMLIQMPLFISLFTLLRESPMVIKEGFGGWLIDLSLPDPLYILPIIYGLIQLLVMFYSGHHTPGQNMGRKLKVIMAIVFTGFMMKMPAALLIYSITSSLSSLLEKGVINKLIAI